MCQQPLRILTVWLPDWPVQRARIANPQLARRALAFSACDGRIERITACCDAARRVGVRVGMRTPDATALAGPRNLLLLPHDPNGDRRALECLAIECQRFSPLVALEAAAEPSALLFDATGLSPLWGGGSYEQGERQLLSTVHRWFGNRLLAARIALAPSAALGLAAARYASFLGASQSVPQRLPDEASSIANRLPVEALRIDEETTDMLHRLGIDSVGLLRELPRRHLTARFGRCLLDRLDQLLGNRPEPLVAVRAEPPLVAEWLFETSVTSGEVLARTVGRLFGRLSQQMQQQGCGALRVLITYRLDTLPESDKSIVLRLFCPIFSARQLSEIAQLHSEGLHFRHAVKAIRVLVGSSAPVGRRQRMLFDHNAHVNVHHLALLINRLANRIGFERVVRVERRRSSDPTRGYASLPATDTEAKRFEMPSWQAERSRHLPLWLKGDEGVSVAVVADSHGTPAILRWNGTHRVVRCWGPERVETGWWHHRRLHRDAYWVEIENAGRCWICFDLRHRRWHLAGEFC